MSKRANPFIEDFIPQRKVHVGLKQFNNNDDRLKKVYEKTLELLFKGAKRVPSPDTLNNNDINFNLVKTYIQSNTTTKQCSCGGSVESQCAYCETALCGTCQHGCERCERAYCVRCIHVGSEGSEVCVSCYS